MNVLINDQPHELRDGACVPEAIAAIEATPPFAVAVNKQFVPRSAYAAHALNADDRIEVIRPVTGG